MKKERMINDLSLYVPMLFVYNLCRRFQFRVKDTVMTVESSLLRKMMRLDVYSAGMIFVGIVCLSINRYKLKLILINIELKMSSNYTYNIISRPKTS
jgi:hypothetical protein